MVLIFQDVLRSLVKETEGALSMLRLLVMEQGRNIGVRVKDD